MCPACGEPLVAFELDGVELDRCVSCGGTWLDDGELERIDALARVEPGALSRALIEARAGARSRRRCPRCRRRLRTISVGPPEPVELDRCPRGHGLWFDAAELRQFVGRFHGLEGSREEGAVADFLGGLFQQELDDRKNGGQE